MAELGLAVVATVDLCLKYGKELRRLCKAFKSAERELAERALILETTWLRCFTQLNFVRKLQHVMDESHLELHEQTLHVLVGKIEIATGLLKRVVEPYIDEDSDSSEVILIPKRVKYAFRKDSIDRALEAIQSWQRIADPSWFLLLKMSDQLIDTELNKDDCKTTTNIPSTLAIRAGSHKHALQDHPGTGLSLPLDALKQMNIHEIQFSSSKIAQISGSTGSNGYILDTIMLPEVADYQVVKKNIRDLARRLQHNEPQTFGLLSCKGFTTERIEESNGTKTTFNLVLRAPEGLTSNSLLEVRSLRSGLLSSTSPGSLSNRFELARQLANATSYIHAFGFVHKNIRPETILVFSIPESQSGSSALNRSSPLVFLVGFDNFRKEEGKTLRIGDDTFEKNLYRHSSRQGISLESDYTMQHDIYSLGVCLLEIGLWRTFINYGAEERPVPSPMLEVNASSTPEQMHQYSYTSSSQQHFLHLARSQLPEIMGTKYSEVVETCLTCLDPENPDFGDPKEFEDEDGICIGVRYIEKILNRLNALYI